MREGMATNEIEGRKTTANNTKRRKMATNLESEEESDGESETGKVTTANKNERRKTAAN
jgi:hypothetical protein